MADVFKVFITVKQLCEWLDLPKSFVYEHTRRGSIDPLPGAFKFGKHLRFKRIEVEKWIEDHRKNA
jgi:excisionase family DNA binding protein